MLFEEEMKDWLVEVAVPVPLRQTFTYKLPPGENPEDVKEGHRVLVPFGPRLMHGVTMTDAYPADTVDPPKKLRVLANYDGRRRILTPEIRKLLHWMKRYYRVPLGEAVKLVMPPGVLSEKEPSFRLTSAGQEFARQSVEARVLALLGAKSMTRKQWENKAQAKIPFADIRRWEQDGYLEIIAEGREKESVPHVTTVRLTPEGGGVDPDLLHRAKKQKEILLWLREQTRELIEVSELNEVFGNASAPVAQLEHRGYVKGERVPKHELAVLQQYVEPDNAKILTPEQKTAYQALVRSLEAQTYRGFLMFGVTGAGKTEVYLRAIQYCLEQGRQALFLVPEIALTPLMQRRIMDRFGERLAILHSAVGAARRSEDWARVLAGKVDVVLGARSGIFAPLPRLGLVIVDEEHDQSYKQNDGIRYHARDLALVRADMVGATVVMGSATPSLESWHNHLRGRLELLTLKKRATNARLPTVDIVDMKSEFKAQRKRPVLSELLQTRMREQLEQGRQVMILLNRRGYFSFLLCRKCGEAVMCDQCEVTLTYHRTDHTLKCHYCDVSRAVPQRCPACDQPSKMMQFFGEGTQQIQDHIQKLFPDFVVDRLDRDRLTNRDASRLILSAFEKGKTHILVGTQMIAKGHDFPNVTLVGIINADQGLRMPDFRSAEVTFQLLTQVAGRSGRGENPGSVVIQTYMPDHYSITNAAKHDYLGFLDRELRYREHMFYSPFAAMAAIMVTHEDPEKARGVIEWMADQLMRFRKKADLVVLGPSRAPIGKIKNAYRFQIVLKSPKRVALHRVADAVVTEVVVKRKMLPLTAVILDIDPYQFF
ncbi:MAG: primosomal protein N' [Acidobacteriota bacterium]|nr:primosomal protein N' [Acidobacteriota bacterium]